MESGYAFTCQSCLRCVMYTADTEVIDTGASRGRDRSPSPRRDERDQRDSRREASYSRSPSPKRGNRHNKSPSHSSHRRRSRSVSSGSSRSYSPPPRKRPAVEKWLAKVAPEQEKFIKTVAGKVKDHGRDFEKMLRDKEKQNPKFGFLFNEDACPWLFRRLTLPVTGISRIQACS